MIQQANQLTGKNVPTTPSAGASSSRAAEIRALGQKATAAQNPTPAANPVADQFHAGIDQAKQGYQDATQAKNPLQETEAGMKMLAGGANAAFSPIAPIMAPIGAAVNAAGNALSDTSLIKEAAGNQVIRPNGATEYVPNIGANRVSEDINNIATVLPLAAGATSPGEVVGKVKSGISAVKDALTPDEAPPGAAEAAAKVKLDTQIKGVEDAWKKPTTVSKASYNNARAVLEKDPAIPKFLAEQKVNPWQHIDKTGNYETADTAQSLRDTAAKMSKDTLRPSLQMADYSTPKTPVADLTRAAIKNLDKDTSLTEGERTSVVKNITDEGTALAKKYPEGMSLENMHDSKITYNGKGGYSPLKSALDNNTATANRALGDAFAAEVDKKFPGAQEFNDYLKKYYRAADYLDALNTKKAPVSTFQNIAHRGAEVVGAAVGHGIGGGILGGVGGYVLGGALEHALENLSNSARGSFLSNLETTNPTAFTKVKAYLDAQNKGTNGILRLPGAGPETPIPLSAPKETPNVAPFAAKTKLPTVNPKTGRMQRTYTSTPE